MAAMKELAMTLEVMVGQRMRGRCITNFTEHVGTIVSVDVAATYADGTPRQFRYAILSDATGREVILWPGTEQEQH